MNFLEVAMDAPVPDPPWLDRALWPWAHRLVPSGGGSVALTQLGEGPPVLFVHGTPTWSIDWRHLIRDWHGARRIAFDHLGFGRSERPLDATYTPQAHAERFARIADTLDLRGATLVLHDFAGPIALPWVLENLDRVDRLVLINTWAWRIDDPSARWIAWLLGGWAGRLLYERANLSLRAIAPSAWSDRSRLTPALRCQHLAPFASPQDRGLCLWPLARALLSAEDHFEDIASRLGALRDLRVDLVWGMKDPAFGPKHLDRWRRELPHARALELPRAGHWPHEEHPDEVRDWLVGAGGRGSAAV